ncbi:hypothetical protein [Rhodonellum sp.]|uniref:hypothetical protein n=1 Tax=Rhodonellum sp. TaxID=2231180 RepID=UPI00271ACA8F|nr:hypothetical protein [Rhodonellum sp.]MDO9551788.1 hypothetical protein [Rhodonellum sp.]
MKKSSSLFVKNAFIQMDKLVVSALLGIYVAIILFGLDKGFDFSDEGMYLMLTDPHQPNQYGLLNYDLFFKLFYRFTGFQFGIVQLRILRLVLYFMAAGFVFRFWLALFPDDWQKGTGMQIVPLILISLFGGYAFLPQSLSYNSLTVVLTCFLFGVYGTAYWKGKSSLITMLFTGTFLAFLFYIKITVFFGFLVLILGFDLFAKKRIIISLLLLLLPLVIMEAIFGLVLGKSGLLSMIEGFQFSQLRDGYGLFHVLKSVLVGIFWSGLIFGSGLLGALFFQSNNRRIKTAFAFCSLSIAFFCIYWITITEESTFYLLFGILFAMGFLTMNKSTKASRPKIKFLLLVLFFLPFVLHFGSNVYFMRLGVHYLFLWILWIMVWLKVNGEFHQLRIAVLAICISFLPFVLDGLWWRPFGLEPIFHQTERFVYQGKKVIFLDREQILFLQNLEGILEKLQAENLQVLPLYSIPGPLYLLNRQIPKTPGIWSPSHFEAYFAKDLNAKVILFNGLDSLPYAVQQNYLRYEHPEKPLIGVEIYVLKENHD